MPFYFPFSLQNNLADPILTNPIPDLRDLVDPNSNQVQQARLLSNSGDYVLDPDTNHFVGMDYIEQQVEMALFTNFGSAAAPIGQQLANIKLITPNLVALVQQEIENALATLLNAGQISIVKLLIIPNTFGQLEVTLYWRNNITQQTLMSNLPLAGQ
jgi:hypothetical protein